MFTSLKLYKENFTENTPNHPYHDNSRDIDGNDINIDGRRKTTYVEEIVMNFLNDLRDSGVTNMYGAVPYILAEYKDSLTEDEMNPQEAQRILKLWMKNFNEESEYEMVKESVQCMCECSCSCEEDLLFKGEEEFDLGVIGEQHDEFNYNNDEDFEEDQTVHKTLNNIGWSIDELKNDFTKFVSVYPEDERYNMWQAYYFLIEKMKK